MRFFLYRLLIVLALAVQGFAQSSGTGWSDWESVEGDWIQFYTLVRIRGGDKTPEELAKKSLKSLKVECFIAGRISDKVTAEIQGVKSIKVIYADLGRFETIEGFLVDFEVVPYVNEKKYIGGKVIRRPASQFDVEEASKPQTKVDESLGPNSLLTALGASDVSWQRKGRFYPLSLHWRRKGSTLEIKVGDYRPAT